VGQRGPAPKPKPILKLTGAYRADRHGKGGPEVKPAAPSPPSWLSVVAKAEWSRIVPQLVRLGVIGLVDQSAIAAYCESWADYVAAVEAVRLEGKTFTTPQGYIAKNPMVTILNESRQAVLKWSQEFGLTPSARSRLSHGGKEEADPFESFDEEQKKHA
jgi:P27 family predicted phage terminase small subunit